MATLQPSSTSPSSADARHAHVGEEQLAEAVVARHRRDRAGLDAGRAHVDEQAGDALVLGHLGVGAHVELAPVGPVALRVPRLLPVDHEVVAVEHRRAPQRGQVGAGLGLGHALAPDLVAAQHRAQEALLLLVGAVGHDRRGDVGDADGVDRAGRAGPGHLLVVGELLLEAGVAAAERSTGQATAP